MPPPKRRKGRGGASSSSMAKASTAAATAARMALAAQNKASKLGAAGVAGVGGGSGSAAATVLTKGTGGASGASSSSNSKGGNSSVGVSKSKLQPQHSSQMQPRQLQANAHDKGKSGTSGGIAECLVLTSEKRRGVYECDYCHSDISQLPRIRCAVCPDFDLCLDCFATTDHEKAITRLKAAAVAHETLRQEQVESGNDTMSMAASGVSTAAANHDHTHGYRVCDSTRFPLFPALRQVVVPSSLSSNETTTTQTQTQTQATGITSVTEDNKDNKNSRGDEAEIASELIFIPEDPKIGWTVEEDLRLLDGIKTHGLGNWVDISEAVNGNGSTGKTPKRCMERYFDDFLGRYGQILPPYTLIEEEIGPDDDNESTSQEADRDSDTNTNTSRSSKRRHNFLMKSQQSSQTPSAYIQSGGVRKKLKAVPTETIKGYDQLWPDPYLPVVAGGIQTKLGQEVGRDQSNKAELAFVKAISGVSKDEVARLREEWMKNRLCQPGGPTVLPSRPEDVMELPGAELAGFMPRRGDFDIEWENEAEQALADMEFTPGDLPKDREIKLQVLQIYNEKLDEREKRKKFILSRNLHDYRKNQKEDEKLPRDERDLVRRMRLFERFHTPEEHRTFIADILKAKRLRKEIAKLQMYRRMGIRSLAEAEKYELDKTRRQFHKIAQLQKDNAPGGTLNSAAAAAAAAAAANDSAVAAALLGDDVGSSLWKQYKTSDRKGRRRSMEGRRGAGVSDNASTPAAGDSMSMAKNDAKTTTTPNANESAPKSSSVDNRNDKNKGEKEKQQQYEKEGGSSSSSNGGFAIEDSKGFDLLSTKEAALCRRTKLYPAQYLEIKKALIHEALTKGLLDKESPNSARRTIVKIDVEKRGNVVDFMVRAGWISSKLGKMAKAGDFSRGAAAANSSAATASATVS